MKQKTILILTLFILFVFIAGLHANEIEMETKTAFQTNRIDPNLEPIVKNLMSANEDDFWNGIEAACMLSERSSNKGVLAIQEAIIRKSENNDSKFFEPGVIKRTIEEQKKSEDKLIALAKEKLLLKDTYNSGNLISTYYAFYGDQKIGDLSEKIKTVGGKEQYRAFILLFNNMWCARQLKK